MADLDQRDSEVLEALQRDFPITSTPYAILGQMVDMSEKEVIKRTLRLRQNGLIRGIQIRFDPKALGCSVALVIASVPENQIESAAEVINDHPGVSQNYRRNHEFNLWSTLCLPPDTQLGLEETVRLLGAEAGATQIHPLPAIRQFHDGNPDPAVTPVVPDENGRNTIRFLQDELPTQPRPFDAIARQLNEHPDTLLDFVREQKEAGTITRIGPVASARARFSTSAMGVWAVPADRLEDVAIAFSKDDGISSSTIREPQHDWPYNLFTIIQGRSVDECEKTMERLAESADIDDYHALFALHEFKQTRMDLFPSGAREVGAEEDLRKLPHSGLVKVAGSDRHPPRARASSAPVIPKRSEESGWRNVVVPASPSRRFLSRDEAAPSE